MFARVVCAFDPDIYRQSMAPLRFPTSGARHGFSVLPTTYWLDSSVESGRESRQPAPVALALPRLPRPIASERTPMPADDRVGLQDTEPAPPLRPYPRPQNPEEPVGLLEAQTPRRAELKHGDLVA